MSLPRLSTHRPTALFASLLLALAAPFANAQTHTVNLTPAWKVGQAYVASVKTSNSSQTVLRQGDKVVQDQTQKSSAHLEADAEAISTFPHGGLRKASFTVRSLRVSTNGAPETEFLPAGTKIVAEGTDVDKKTFTVNGRPATPEQEAILKLVISTDDPKHNDQLIFGPKAPVAVGESWKPDLETIKATIGKDFGPQGVVTSTMKLDAVEGSGASQINIVSGNVTVDGFTPPLPPGVTAKSGVFRVTLGGRIPATRTASKREETLTGTAHFVGEAQAPDGTTFTVTVSMETKNATVLTFP